MAGITQEQAVKILAVEVGTLSGYENGNRVAEDVVDMTDIYNAPLLAI